MTLVGVKAGLVNVFVLRDERTVLIDAGLAGGGKALLRKLSSMGIERDSVALILITHGHTDHFGGAAELHALTGAPVAVHAADAQHLQAGTNPPVVITSKVSRWVKDFIDEKSVKKIQSCEPQILIEGEFELSAFGVDARVVHTPGHTPGSVSVVTESNEAVIGDLLMGRLVNTHQPRWPFFADDLEEVGKSLRLLLAAGVQTFYVSHGGPFTRKNIERFLASSTKEPGALLSGVPR